MPRTVHQLLIHGHDLITNFSVPIGILSEEAQERLNKDYKYLRSNNTRKTCRLAGNKDLLHHLLMSSDPVISSLRKPPKYNKKQASELSDDVTQLLICDD